MVSWHSSCPFPCRRRIYLFYPTPLNISGRQTPVHTSPRHSAKHGLHIFMPDWIYAPGDAKATGFLQPVTESSTGWVFHRGVTAKWYISSMMTDPSLSMHIWAGLNPVYRQSQIPYGFWITVLNWIKIFRKKIIKEKVFLFYSNVVFRIKKTIWYRTSYNSFC